MRSLLNIVFVVGMSVLIISCGSSTSSSSSSSGTGFGDTTSVTGSVFAPNGTDPVAGATVFIPASAVSSSINADKAYRSGKTVTATCSEGDVTCPDPSSTAVTGAATCSCADGSFTLDSTEATADNTQICVEKGSLQKCSTPTCTDATCALTATETSFPTSGSGSISIAVVTGLYDEIENVLAKLGFGSIDSDGKLVVGSETFTIYRGGGIIDSQLTDTDKYPEDTALFSSSDTMSQYDVIFINCGADEDLSSLAAANLGASISHKDFRHVHKELPSSVIANLQTYVNAGGKLYVTDLAYDFIEQPFPDAMDFEDGSEGDSSTAETDDDAEDGDSSIVTDATVKETDLKNYLASSSAPSNTINDADNSPNIGYCETTVNGNADSLNDDDTIRIGDFLSGWAVMKEAYDTTTTVWLEGPVSFTGSNGEETRPLTISRTVGSNGGEIFYSSYHTSESCPTTGFWPQERVLQYFVFEVIE